MKGAGFEMNIQKSLAFLYTKSKLAEKEIRKISHLKYLS
jgi:hypothetical protein